MKKKVSKLFSTGVLLMTMLLCTQTFANNAGMDPNFDTGIPIGFNNDVSTLVVQGDGKIVAGGNFTTYKGVVANRIARLNADGTKDASFLIGSGCNDTVNITAIQSDGKIIVGGLFTTYNGIAAHKMIRLNADGTPDTSFMLGNGFNDSVKSIAIQSDGKILVGGLFTSYNGTSTNRIIRLNTDGTIDTTFTIGAGFDNGVSAIVMQSDGMVVVGGSFTTYNGSTANRIVRITNDGTIDTTFAMGIGCDKDVLALALQSDGKIVVGGSFTTYNGTSTNSILRLNTDGTIDTSFASSPIGTLYINQVQTLLLQSDGKIVAGGYFYGGAGMKSIVRLNTDGTQDTQFMITNGFNDAVAALALQSDGKILIGGKFTTYDYWNSANKITRVNEDGTQDTTFNVGNGFDGGIYALALQSDGKVMVAGSFLTYKGTPANKLLRLNADGSRDDSFVVGAGFNGDVGTIALQSDGKIILGGWFNWYGDTAANNIVRVNPDGSRDESFVIGEGFDSGISAIVVQSDGKIIVGGQFTTYNGLPANGIIRLNADGSRDDSFVIGDGFSNYVQTLALAPDGKIVVAGGFTEYNGEEVKPIIRLNTDGTRDTTFNAPRNVFNKPIYSFVIQSDGKVIIGGDFDMRIAKKIIRLNTDGTQDTSFAIGAGFNGPVGPLKLQSDGKLLVGGEFSMYNGSPVKKLICLNPDGSRDTSFDAGNGFDASGMGVLDLKDDGEILFGGGFTNYNGAAVGYLMSLYGNSTVVTLPNSTDSGVVVDSFTSQGYTEGNGNLIGSTPISLSETDGNIPLGLGLENENIILSLPANTQLQEADTSGNYNGIINVPIVKDIASVNDEPVISSFKVGSSSESITLVGGTATILSPAPGKNIGDVVQIYYSQDNGVTWYPQTMAVVIAYNGEPYVSFPTNHFTDFAITNMQQEVPYVGSMVINADAVSTTSSDVTLDMSVTPFAAQMRLSNDNVNRSDWETYADTKEWTLGDYGTVTIYVQFDINADSSPDINASDSIVYIDTTPVLSGGNTETIPDTSSDTGVIPDITNDTGIVPDTTNNPEPTSVVVNNGNSRPSGGGGGGGSNPSKDICPNGDFSANFYDGNCGKARIVNVISTGEIENNLLSPGAYTQEYVDAYSFAFTNGMISAQTIDDANMKGALTRAAMAQMISNFAINVLKKSASTSAECSFSDIGNLSKASQDNILLACELGLMGYASDGVTVNDTFKPNQVVSRAQFGTILSRLLRGTKYNNGSPYYQNHLNALKDLGIMTKIATPSQKEIRGSALVMLQRTSGVK
ncbi:MAG: S-layer homology domain-containing protein [candidate division SR1 bacterium]|nr:S-layer homology domain-containing protein [candidate division SR1 bacterium]